MSLEPTPHLSTLVRRPRSVRTASYRDVGGHAFDEGVNSGAEIFGIPDPHQARERPEPTFLITKPFQPETVKATIGQALFFHPNGTRRERPAA